MRIAVSVLIAAFMVAATIALFLYFFRGDVQDNGAKDEARRPAGLGVYRTMNAGEEWALASKIDPEGSIDKLEIVSFVNDPLQPQIVYALSSGGLLKTNDFGDTWTYMVDETGYLAGRTRINGIGLDSTNSEQHYMAAFAQNAGRLLRTRDGGKRWEQVYAAVGGEDIPSVAVDPKDPKTVYAGTGDGLLLQSQDFGTSWKTLYQFRGGIADILIPPSDSRVIYVVLAGKKGFWKSEDYGATWEDLAHNLTRFTGAVDIRALAIDPRNANRFFLGSAFGLLETKDGGETFTAPPLVISAGSLPVTAIALDSKNQNTFYVGASNGFYRTVDGGEHWTQKELLTRYRVGALLLSKEDPDVILAGIRK